MVRKRSTEYASRNGYTGSPPVNAERLIGYPIYVGKVESPDYGVSTRGDFEPLVDEATFYRAQAVLDARVVVAGSRQRNHPDFPLRGFVRCETCGRPLTGSWSQGRNGCYAYYHCQRQCRAVNVSRAALEPPRASGGRVQRVASIVRRQPRADVACEAGVPALRLGGTSQDMKLSKARPVVGTATAFA